MQIGETVAVAAFSVGGETCPMEPHTQVDGFTQARRPSDKDVSRLRRAMTDGRSTRMFEQESDTKFVEKEQLDGPVQECPTMREAPILILGQRFPLSVAAHHVILGKATLPKSNLKKYIWAKFGEIKTDIGYDVDGSENGLWMPTHQSMSAAMGKAQAIVISKGAQSAVVVHDEEDPPTTRGQSWRTLSKLAKNKSGDTEATYSNLFLQRYTQQAMFAMSTQFHDSHSNYNTFVGNRLTAISVQIGRKIGMCEKGCKETEAPYLPPYLLVCRLNQLSAQMKTFLTGLPRPIWKSVYTSDLAKLYYESPLSARELGDIDC